MSASSSGTPRSRRPRLAPFGLWFLVNLAAAAFVLLALKPLGTGPVPLPATAYSLSTAGEQPARPQDKSDGPAAHVLQAAEGRTAKISFLFHRPLTVRVRLRLTPPAGVAMALADLRKNGARVDGVAFATDGTASAEVPVARGDQLTVALPARAPGNAHGARLQVNLASAISPSLYIPIVLIWAVLLVVLQRMGRPFLSVLALSALALTCSAELRNFGPLSFPSLTASTCLVFSFMILTVFLTNWRVLRATISSLLTFVLLLVLFVLPVIYFGYAISFGKPIEADILNAIFQTNSSEALEFLFYQFGIATSLFVLVAAAIVILVSYLEMRFLHPSPPSILTAVCCGLLFFYTGLQQENLRILQHFSSIHRSYISELAAFRRTLELRAAAGRGLRAEKAPGDEVHVLVIGESQSRNNMSLYGYARPTTPNLDRLAASGELLACRNAFSSHTHTTETLSLALTSANQQNGEDFFASASLLDIARAAGFETVWISNQAMYGPWDNVVSALAARADAVHRLNTSIGESTRTQEFDEAVVPVLGRFLDGGANRNGLAIIHLMGNHGNYCDRYPPEFATFEWILRSSIFGEIAGKFDRTLNCYDNSMLYNDFVVNSIVDILRKSTKTAAVMYFADHAEDVLGGQRHASSQFTYPMTEIPTFFWFSDGYEKLYPEKKANVEKHLNELFPNDFVYDTIIGVMGIATDEYDARWDLSSASYRLDESEAVTLGGKRRFVVAQNTAYQQRKNLQLLVDSGLAMRVIPHRVNTLGKLCQVIADGAHGVEVDVRADVASGSISVGHDAEKLTDGTLDEFLSAPAADTLRKLWLDVKNVTPDNAAFFQEQILDLDRRYALRDRTIIETSNPTADLGALRAAGFRTSYYLPTDAMLTAIQEGDDAALVELADSIARRVAGSSFDAISFDARVYPFVSTHLAPRLDPTVVFHSWDLTAKLWQPGLIEQLRQRDVFNDPRVATILLPYDSVFSY